MSIVRVEKNTYKAETLHQWDSNQELQVYGLSLATVPEVHFTNAAMDRAIVRQARMDAAGVIFADIPNSLLQKPYTVTAYICAYTGGTFETLYKIDIKVEQRQKPGDYTLEGDTEVYSFNALENAVANALIACEGATAAYNAGATAMNTAKNAYNEAVEKVSDEAKSAAAEAVSALTADDVGAYPKGAVLADGVKTQFGLDASAAPTDVFALLAPYTQHWWWLKAIKLVTVYEETRAAFSKTLYFTKGGTYYYSDTIEIDQTTGAVSLVNAVFVDNSTSDIVFNTLPGKYVQSTDGSIVYNPGTNELTPFDGILYVRDPSSNGLSNTYTEVKSGGVYIVSSTPNEIDVGGYFFAHSTDRSAYPDSGTDANFEYKYIGVPLDNAVVALTDDDMAAVIREGVDAV